MPPAPPISADTVIVGGGIAGLATAWQLALRGYRPLLVEREPTVGSHASGRNAAIFRQLDTTLAGTPLALRSGVLLDALCGARAEWCNTVGAMYVAARKAALGGLLQLAEAHHVVHNMLEGAQLHAAHDTLISRSEMVALHVPSDGVIDIWAVLSALRHAAQAVGAQVICNARVTEIECSAGRVHAVHIGSARVATPLLINAAGAWASQLAQLAGRPLQLRPLRRHLMQMRFALAAQAPVVWRIDDEWYFRPESGGILVSACDEALCDPDDLRTDARIVDEVARKVGPLAPGLQAAQPTRVWPCVRTFAADRNVVIGLDDKLRGYAVIAGLGGHGMSAGVAAAEHLVERLCGAPPTIDVDFASALRDAASTP